MTAMHLVFICYCVLAYGAVLWGTIWNVLEKDYAFALGLFLFGTVFAVMMTAAVYAVLPGK